MTHHPIETLGPATLDPEMTRREIRRFLAEDVGSGDETTARVVPAGKRGSGSIVTRQACVLAGLGVAAVVFAELDHSLVIEARVSDGDQVAAETDLLTISGHLGPILTGERLALNLLQRLSGVATMTRRYAHALEGTHAVVSDTRKTTPGLRVFEKYAVRVGGGRNHRIGLFDAILIKDNHILAAGGVVAAIRAAQLHSGGTHVVPGWGEGPGADQPHSGGAHGVPNWGHGVEAGVRMPIQVEIDTLDQLAEALDCGVDAFLLDNMTPEQVAEAVRTIRAHPRGGKRWIEASGGITLQNIRAYAEAGVDTISVGALTHSAPSVDIALDLEQMTD